MGLHLRVVGMLLVVAVARILVAAASTFASTRVRNHSAQVIAGWCRKNPASTSSLTVQTGF